MAVTNNACQVLVPISRTSFTYNSALVMPWITLANYDSEYCMVCPEEGKVVFNRTFYFNPWYTSKDSCNPARSEWGSICGAKNE